MLCHIKHGKANNKKSTPAQNEQVVFRPCRMRFACTYHCFPRAADADNIAPYGVHAHAKDEVRQAALQGEKEVRESLKRKT